MGVFWFYELSKWWSRISMWCHQITLINQSLYSSMHGTWMLFINGKFIWKVFTVGLMLSKVFFSIATKSSWILANRNVQRPSRDLLGDSLLFVWNFAPSCKILHTLLSGARTFRSLQNLLAKWMESERSRALHNLVYREKSLCVALGTVPRDFNKKWLKTTTTVLI